MMEVPLRHRRPLTISESLEKGEGIRAQLDDPSSSHNNQYTPSVVSSLSMYFVNRTHIYVNRATSFFLGIYSDAGCSRFPDEKSLAFHINIQSR